MDDNPLIVRNRFQRGVQYGTSESNPIIIEDYGEEGEKHEQYGLFQFITSFYMTLISMVMKLNINKVKESEESDTFEPLVTGARYTSPPPLLTDDYNRINPPEIHANSILIDDDEELESGSDSESFGQLLKKLINNQAGESVPKKSKHQYGTDLSISQNHMNQSGYQRQYVPRVLTSPAATTPRLNQSVVINDDQYRNSIIRYYNRYIPQPPKSYSFIDDIIPNYHVDTQFSDNYKQNQLDKIKQIEIARLKSKSLVKPLTENQLAKVQTIWNSITNKLIVTNFQIDIKISDLQTLNDGKWLNDNVIDYYINMIMMDNSAIFGWTTHFYSTLQTKGYAGVARWAKRKKINLFDKKIIIVPINIHNYHWALAVINNTEQTITYYDSIESSGTSRVLHDLQEYMDKEAQRLSRSNINYNLNFHGNSPQQSNGSDCGVFTCTNAKLLANNQQLNYSQKDMKSIRRRMVYEISMKMLLD